MTTARTASRIPWRMIRRAAIGLSIAALVFTAFMGFLHTKAGRPLMARLGMKCPVGNVTPAQAVASRAVALEKLRGDEPAPSRPALGFSLETTTLADVQTWASQNRVTCADESRGFPMLRCTDVPAVLLGEATDTPIAESVLFAFTQQKTLMSVDELRRHLPADVAAKLYEARSAALSKELGPPSATTGDPSAKKLASTFLDVATTTYRFRDYLGTLTVMNLGEHGVAVREQLGSANKPSM